MNIPENFDRWMFDYMEGNLSAKEAETFEQFLVQNPGFEADAEAWENAVLSQETVIYPNQHKLQRKRKLAGWYVWGAAAALILSLLSGGYFLLNRQHGDVVSATDMLKNVTTPLTADNQIENVDNEASAQKQAFTFFRNRGQFMAAAQQHRQIGFSTLNNSPLLGVNNGSNVALNMENANANTNTYQADNTTLSANFHPKKGNSKKGLKQEQDKLQAASHAAQYKNNPTLSLADFDLSKKSSVNINSFSTKAKRIYRKIEKMFGYPVALVNLRDPELLVPENGLVSSNPGFAGGMLMPRFEMIYRNQWLGSEMNGQKLRFSFDNYVADMRGGLGMAINASTFALGGFGDYSVDLTYSPKITLSKNIVFEPGIKVSLGAVAGNRSKLDAAGLVELDRGLVLDNSLVESSDEVQKLWYQDYGLGFVLNTTWFYAGFSADNLGRHFANTYLPEGNVEPVRSPILYNGIVGADYESRNKSMTFSPFVSARQFGQNAELWAGMNYRLKHFTLGGAYSTNQDFTAAIGMKFKHFKLVYQFDKTHNLINNEQLASHNLSIRINGGTKNSRFK